MSLYCYAEKSLSLVSLGGLLPLLRELRLFKGYISDEARIIHGQKD
jgi:hypothetical protein